MVKVWLVRLLWRLATLLTRFGGEKFELPPHVNVFDSWHDLVESCLTTSLIETYISIFSTSRAWLENHEPSAVRDRLAEQLTFPARISILRTENNSVSGFCWGQVLDLNGIISSCKSFPTIANASAVEIENLDRVLNRKLGTKRALFVHELGLVRSARGGLDPLRFLFLPILQKASDNGVNAVIWWTNSQSHAYKLSEVLGFEKLCDVDGITYFYLPDLRPVLEVGLRLDSRKLRRIFVLASKGAKARKRK